MQQLSWITEPSVWASLATLTCLEIVLGIDNLVFITHRNRQTAGTRPTESSTLVEMLNLRAGRRTEGEK